MGSVIAPRVGLDPREIDQYLPWFALHMADSNSGAVPWLQLVEQGQRGVVVDKAHGLTEG